MKKILLVMLATFISCSLVVGASAINQDEFTGETADDHFIILDEEGNPIVVEVEDTFDKKEYKESLKDAEIPAEEAAKAAGQPVEITIDEAEDTTVNVDALLNNRKVISSRDLVRTDTSKNQHIVRFKTQAEIGSSTINYIEVDTGREGYISTNSSNDAAYIDTVNGKIRCKLSGVVIDVNSSYVKSIVPYTEGNVSYYYISEGKLYHKYSYISGSSVNMTLCRIGYQPSYMQAGISYYSYDGHYFYTSFAQMIADYRAGNYSHAVNSASPYYNYYQYLSLRSTTKLTANDMNTRTKRYVSNYSSAGTKMYELGQTFIDVQNEYGINASLMYGLAYNESACGTSNIAQTKNNLFGLGAVDSSPYASAGVYPAPKNCIIDFADRWMSKGYLDGGDYRYRGPHFGDKHSGINVKYASDAYWGEKAAAQSYYMNDDNNIDYKRYTIAISSLTELSLYKDASTNKRIYTSGVSGSGKKGYLYDYPLIVLENYGSWSKVQSDMPLKSDRSARDINAKYNFGRDYVYAENRYIYSVSTGQGSVSNYLRGDISGDGKVSPLDYIMIKEHIMGTNILTGDALNRGDVSQDGKISPLDYIMVKEHIMGTNKLF